MGKFALLMYMSEFRLRVSSFDDRNSKSNHLGAKGTFNPSLTLISVSIPARLGRKRLIFWGGGEI